MNRLFVVRHGNTFEPGEETRRIGLRTDLPLVVEGIMQARALGRLFELHGIVFAAALSSGSRRASETAALILAMAGSSLSPQRLAWLDEVDHGPDEDQPERRVVARVGRTALTIWDQKAIPPAGWIVDASRRITGWTELLANPPVGDALITTSSGAARFALVAAGVELPPSLKLRTGAYGVLACGRDGRWRLDTWDSRAE